MEIPGWGAVQGHWEIHPNESEYLGQVDFKGKSVLEIGPASGLLTFFMESRMANVVSLEAADDYAWEFYWDLQETVPEDLQAKLDDHLQMMKRVKNSYWLCHRAFSSKARVHYGSAYSVPAKLGKFDIAVLACMLLHNKNPLRIIENCARASSEMMIIVEPYSQFPHASMEFLPTDYRHCWHTWWRFSPKFMTDVLASLGFPYNRVTFHTQRWFGEPFDLYTVVAGRKPLKEIASDTEPVQAELSCPVQRITVGANRATYLPVTVVNQTEITMSSASEYPTHVSYHWKDRSGKTVTWDGIRTAFQWAMAKGESQTLVMTIRTPSEPGDYILEITMVKEGITWYDNNPGLPLQIECVVTV